VELAIHDECGGLLPGEEQSLTRALQLRDKSDEGLGRGLLVVRNGIEACGGALRVRDVPGRGCVFSILLPIRPT
jgi:signal transduction histidine kinase